MPAEALLHRAPAEVAVLLDQRDAAPGVLQKRRADQAGGPRADHDDVVRRHQ
jgi:hypothetical protein